MQRYRIIVVLVVLVAAAAAAAVLVQREDAGIAQSGEKLLPGLLDRLGEVSRIESTHKGETITLALADGSWSVTDRHGYPAEASEVRGLLVGAAELVRVEPKTARAELYEKLELGDPADAEGESFGYVMKDAGGDTIADLVVGKRRFVSAATPDTSTSTSCGFRAIRRRGSSRARSRATDGPSTGCGARSPGSTRRAYGRPPSPTRTEPWCGSRNRRRRRPTSPSKASRTASRSRRRSRCTRSAPRSPRSP